MAASMRTRCFCWLGAVVLCAPYGLAAQGPGSPTTTPPELVPQLGLPAWIFDLAVSPDGRWLAAGSEDGAHLIDADTGAVARTWGSTRVPPRALTFSPNGNLLAFGEGMRIRLCDVASGADRLLEGHVMFVGGLGFTPDGRWLVSGPALSFDGKDSIRLWDTETGRQAKQLPGPNTITGFAASPDGRWYAYGARVDPAEETAGEKSLVGIEPLQIEASAGGTTTKRFVGMRGQLSALEFSPDGRFLAAAVAAPGFESAGVIHWIDVAAGKLESKRLATPRKVEALAFSRDGRWLAAATSGGVAVFETATMRAVRMFRELSASSLAFTRDAQALWVALSGIGGQPPGLALFDMSSTREIRRLPLGTQLKALALGSDRGIVATLHTQRGAALEGKNSIGLLDTASGERKLVVYDDWSGNENAIGLSHDLSTFVTVKGTELTLWDAASGEKRRTFSLPSGVWVKGITSGRPGSPWMVQGQDSSSRGNSQPAAWTILVDGTLERILWQQREEQSFRTTRHGAMSPDGTRLALSRDSKIAVHDALTGKQIHAWWHDGDVNALRFSPDGRRLVSIGGLQQPLQVWDVESGQPLHTWGPIEKESGLSMFALHPDGVRVATAGGADGTFRISRLDGATLHTIAGDAGRPFALAFGPDGRWLASQGRSAIRFWDTETGASLAVLYVSGTDEDWLVASPDGLFDASAHAWGRASFRHDGKLVGFAEADSFFDRFRTPGLLSDLLTGKKPGLRDSAKLDRRQATLKLALKAPLGGSPPAGLATVSIEVAEAPPAKTQRLGSGAHDVLLFANGILAKVWPGQVLAPGAGRTVLEADVVLTAGENHLFAQGFNSQHLRGPAASLVIAVEPAAPPAAVAAHAQGPWRRRSFEPGGPETQVFIGRDSVGKAVGAPRQTGAGSFEVTTKVTYSILLFVDQAGARLALERLRVPEFEVQDWELLLRDDDTVQVVGIEIEASKRGRKTTETKQISAEAGQPPAADTALESILGAGDFPKLVELEFEGEMKAKELQQHLERELGRTQAAGMAETAAFTRYLSSRSYRRGDKVVVRISSGDTVLTNVAGQELPPLRGRAFALGLSEWLFVRGRFGRVADVFR